MTDLCVDSHILKVTSNTAQSLVKMMALSQRMRDRLKNLLVLFGMDLMDLLYGANIVLQVHNSMFPCLQPLCEQSCGLIERRPCQRDIRGGISTRLTVVGSISGTASSPKVVLCLRGNVFESPLMIAHVNCVSLYVVWVGYWGDVGGDRVRSPFAELGGGTKEGKRVVERDYSLQATGCSISISRKQEVRCADIYCTATATEVGLAGVAGRSSGSSGSSCRD